MNDIKKHEPVTITYVDKSGNTTVRTHIFFEDQTKWNNVKSLDVSHLGEDQVEALIDIVKEYSAYLQTQHVMSIQDFIHMTLGEEPVEDLIKFRSLNANNITKGV